jgi:hypothetical protein
MPLLTKLLFVATKLPPFVGWKPPPDRPMEREMLERLNEIQQHLLEVGELSEDEVLLDRLREYEADVEAFVEEVRAARAMSDGSSTALPPIVWRIISREFHREPLVLRIWEASSLLFLATWPSSEPMPPEAKPKVMREFFDGQCAWLWVRRKELLTPAEIDELSVDWEDVPPPDPN